MQSVILALALSSAAAFQAPVAVRQQTCLSANILDTAKALEGPAIPWGSAGVLEGHEENEIKGYDGLTTFLAQVEAAGLTDVLNGPGPFTVFAPTDSAFEETAREITPELLKYHVVSGVVKSGSISGPIETVQGQSLTYKRFARKTFLDDAIIGQGPSGAATGSSFPVDVVCDNGIIHCISTILYPDYKAPGAEDGLGGI